jgi:hypothetical protein
MGMKIDANVKVVMNQSQINKLLNAPSKALIKTAMAVETDLQTSQTIPFDTGTLQNEQTSVDPSKASSGTVQIVSDTPYARRLYFHPEYNFRHDKNPNAGGKWFDPYINGNLVNWVKETYTELLRRMTQ